MGRLDGKVIILTGASGGIGSESALIFAREGARLVLADLDEERLAELSDRLRQSGNEATVCVADISDEDSVRGMVETAVRVYGRLDGAFNNAGIEQHNVLLHELAEADWDRCININLSGVFLCMKHQIRAMMSNGGGSIVNTSSGLGAAAIERAGEYIAAKHGVIGLTRAAAVEYSRLGIRVNSILPGVIETPMIERARTDPAFSAMFDELTKRHPIGRLGRPSEIAEGAVWLLSDSASFVTGTSLPIDGGYLVV